MTVSRNLNVNLSVITGAMEKGFKKAGGTVKEFVSSVKEMGVKVAELGLAAGLAAGVGLALLVRHQIEEIDTNSKLANELRTTMEGLAGLQLAAKLSGLEAETLNKGLTHLTKSMGELGAGQKSAVEAFGALGLAQKDLAGLPTDKAMMRIADAFHAQGNSAKSTTAIMEIFGAKVGAKFVNMLSEGSEGLSKATDEAKRLGLAVNEVDAAQVEAANEAMIKAGEAAKGLGNKIAVELSPYIEAAANALTEFRANAGGILTVAGLLDKVSEHAAILADAVDIVKVVWNGFWLVADSVVWAVVAPIKKILEGLDWVLQKLHLGATGTAEFMEGWQKGIEKNINKDWMGLKSVGDTEGKIKSVLDTVKAKMAGIKDEAKKHGEELTKSRAKLQALGTQMEQIATAKAKHDKDEGELKKKLAELTKKNESPAEKFREGIKQLNDMIAKAKELKIQIPQTDIDRERKRLTDELEKELKPKVKTKENMEVSAVTKFSAESISALSKIKNDPTLKLIAEQVEHRRLLTTMNAGIKTMAENITGQPALANL